MRRSIPTGIIIVFVRCTTCRMIVLRRCQRFGRQWFIAAFHSIMAQHLRNHDYWNRTASPRSQGPTGAVLKSNTVQVQVKTHCHQMQDISAIFRAPHAQVLYPGPGLATLALKWHWNLCRRRRGPVPSASRRRLAGCKAMDPQPSRAAGPLSPRHADTPSRV